MNNRRIVVAVTNDLVTDQRVHRSCMALHEAGYSVTLVGRRLKDSVPLNRPYKTVRMRLLFKKKVFFYAEYNMRLFLRLMFSPADAFYANDTDTLPANWLAARLRRTPFFFDAHEMFPEVPELVGRPRVKRFWSGIEDRILPKMAHRNHTAAATVCQSIADIYRQRYGINMAVVRNVPMRKQEGPVHNMEKLDMIPQGRRILLYQGAVNIGRGIEWVMAAMPYLSDCHFVVAGVGDMYEKLRADAEMSTNITFLGRVEPDVLRGITEQADLGISLLENRGLNYYYSLPNRIADFVQAGVPVLATDFPEIHRVVEGFGIGSLVPPFESDSGKNESATPDAQQLAETIRTTLNVWDSMPMEERKSRFARAANDLSWENDKKTLLQAVDTIFI